MLSNGRRTDREGAVRQGRDEARSIPVVVLTAKDLTPADHERLRGSIDKVLRKGSLSHEQLLAEVGTVLTGYGRPPAAG